MRGLLAFLMHKLGSHLVASILVRATMTSNMSAMRQGCTITKRRGDEEMRERSKLWLQTLVQILQCGSTIIRRRHRPALNTIRIDYSYPLFCLRSLFRSVQLDIVSNKEKSVLPLKNASHSCKAFFFSSRDSRSSSNRVRLIGVSCIALCSTSIFEGFAFPLSRLLTLSS